MSDQLIQAAADGDTASVIALLEGGADIDWQGDDGRTPVMAATVGNHADTVRALIDAEANVDIRDARLDNPFLYAGAEGLLDILRLTIDAGADPSLTNRFGGTALIPASERGHVDVVRELLTEHRRRRRPRQQPRLDRAAGGDRPEQRRRTAPAGRPAAGRSRGRHHDRRQGRRHAARTRSIARIYRDRTDPRRGWDVLTERPAAFAPPIEIAAAAPARLLRAAADDREDLGGLAVLEREVGAPLEVDEAGRFEGLARLVS